MATPPTKLSNAVIIVESPAKIKPIEGYLGLGYKVLASYGHIRDLPSKEGAVDPENDFAMQYVVQADSEKNVKAILAALKNADTLYLATDPDREGEAISWHVWQEIKARDPKLAARLSVHRSVFSEITKTAIQHAIAHPRELALNLVNAQQARRALDYLVGFNLSPVLWKKVRRGLSAGRVQSVALRLICEREDAIEAFKAEEYWSIHGHFITPNGKALPSNLATYGGKKTEKFSFVNQAVSAAAVAALSPLAYTIAGVEKSPKSRYPSAPFITSTLQQEASRKLGFGARRTMNAAQRLYEAGHISYMRTDSVALANEAVQKIRAAIAKTYGADQMPSAPITYKSKSKNAQEAHEAVRPTDPFMHPSQIKAEPDQQRLYELIWRRTMACQMAPAKLEQTTITITEKTAQHTFRATGSVVVFPGFLSVYQEGTDDDTADENDRTLPAVKEGETLTTRMIEPVQHFTEPPPRFSEASLVKALEEYGIGRPSTYASIISTLQDRGYVKIEKKRFEPEDVGRVVGKFLTEHFTKYVDYNFTANMEEDLDAIARGEHDWKPTLRNFWKPFKALVDDKTESVNRADVTQEATGEKCPECAEGMLSYRLGKFGRFKGCNRYPECSYIEKKEGAGAAQAGEDTGVACPTCTGGKLLKRTSRRGIVFYSCSTYPTCTFSCWDPPVAKPCPSCKASVISIKTTKRYGEVEKCPTCNWWSNEEAKAASEAFKARFAKGRNAKAEAKAAAATAAKAAKAAAKVKTSKPKAAAKPKATAKSKAPAKAKPTKKSAA